MIRIHIKEIIDYYDKEIFSKFNKGEKEMICAANQIFAIKFEEKKITETILYEADMESIAIDLSNDDFIVNIEFS